jgi:hypothetical protein
LKRWRTIYQFSSVTIGHFSVRSRPSGGPLADQPGKVAKTCDQKRDQWLNDRCGYAGTSEDALSFFLALPAEQQRIFLRQVCYAELTAGGRKYNDQSGPRPGSHLRGREAMAAPTVQGPPLAALTSATNTAAATQQLVAPTQTNTSAASVMISRSPAMAGDYGSAPK